MRLRNTNYDISLHESKEDQEKFINKFGQETFDNFNKAKDRLKNKGYSTDILYYVKNTSMEDMNKLLVSLYDKKQDAQKKRIIQGTDKEIRGKYNYRGEKNGYKVYEPLDVQASMDLGVNTGWCTTGRYGHAGHPEFTPSLRDAKKHWKEYIDRGDRLFYFLDAETMYGKYAILYLPEVWNINREIGNIAIKKVNFEIYNEEDDLDWKAIFSQNLPFDLLPVEIVCETEKLEEIEIKDGTLVRYRGTASKFVIPDGVIRIGNSAFRECKSLTSIEIGNSVASIGAWAFYGCSSLTSIEIPNSVTNIENSAFSGCSSLTSIIIPKGITKISRYTFNGCTSLTNISIPDSVTEIEICAFNYCNNLTSIEIPKSVTSIGNYSFEYCNSLTNIEIPNSVTSIGYGAFDACDSLTNVKISQNLKEIEGGAFHNCANLTSIEIPNSVKYIGKSAFEGCSSLTRIEIPNSVTSIEESSFYTCKSLTNIEIPNSVTSIGDNAFYGCKSLTNIEIPNSVTYIGWGAFAECKNLNNVSILSNSIFIASYVFQKCSRKLIIKTNNPTVVEYCREYGINVSPLNEGYNGMKLTQLNESKETDEIEKYIEDIYELRKSSLSKDGEYGIGNLVFKEMRAQGYLDKLKDLKNELKGQELSLENLE